MTLISENNNSILYNKEEWFNFFTNLLKFAYFLNLAQEKRGH